VQRPTSGVFVEGSNDHAVDVPVAALGSMRLAEHSLTRSMQAKDCPAPCT
jgi:hypothetical protein